MIRHIITSGLVLTGAVLYSQSDSIYALVEGNTATIYHTQTYRNCGSRFQMEVELVSDTLTITETDTGMLAFCMCYFDLSVTVGPLDPGDYYVEVYGTDTLYGEYWGSTTFTIPGIQMLEHQVSDCLGARDDSSAISISVTGDTMTLLWDTPLLNCCLEPFWSGILVADSFQVTMLDTGPPCDCICPFQLQAAFGPFPPGRYILDFRGGLYGYPVFSIGSGGLRDSSLIISASQSDCYDLSVQYASPGQPAGVLVHGTYPNPFNPVTTIHYQLLERTAVTVAIYDLEGRLVEVLLWAVQNPGEHSVSWHARQTGTGIYLYRITAGLQMATGKCLLLK